MTNPEATGSDGKELFDAAGMPDQVERTLLRPIEAHGKTIKKLVCRRPKARDFTVIGMPLDINFATGEIRIRHDDMQAMIAHLSDIPVSSVQEMDSVDYMTLASRLQGFFIPILTEDAT